MKTDPYFKYDDMHDVMHVFIDSDINAFDDEDFPGVYVTRNDDTGKIVGFIVLDYKRKNEAVVKKHFHEYFH
ncbi:MAG: hypothetical protein IJ575_09125 [Selenomonadaceae bacterium]|nr:hypothetical protein [Selenomonadaceae bacterium]